MLTVNNVSKTYSGKMAYRALEDVSFDVKESEYVGIMGPSGSGKTTLLNIVATIDSPTSGSVLLDGKSPHELKEKELSSFRAKQLGFVFQNFQLLDTLTVAENIVLPLTLDGQQSIEEMKQSVEEISLKLGIDDLLDKRTYELSGGQLQRTAIARALIHQPRLLLADEPTGNLDSKASGDVMNMLNKMNQEERTTILMVTHDPVVASYCDRILFIKDGKLFNEIYKGDNREAFYQNVVQVLSLMGGDNRDLSSVRLS
ncbi:ABC transporter ATP-binding protein [Alkalicoccobacillus murimartini]|uniref:ABC transport system ATP-binding protein n=1 Tax=Alkalicoccobacillus murimartini TaxID=171685 RepID=A0ABT9YLK3_9BACI|nr:ABC transporter ATP-binding protein [Alkalicoccobacillus murimartini]MDQ0208365.1 putative ABC transport system ATP-binding protein [Alkalicoccobacillus murimartini]